MLRSQHPGFAFRLEEFSSLHLGEDQVKRERFMNLVEDLLVSEFDLTYRKARCLEEAVAALSDIAEGEPESSDAAVNLQWAEERASETLSLIGSVMRYRDETDE